MTLVRTAPRQLGALAPVGPLAYGLWRFTNDDVAAAQRLVETALDAGLNLFDTSDVYGFDWGGTGFGQVEEILGRRDRGIAAVRDRMVLATKGGIVAADSVRLVSRSTSGPRARRRCAACRST